jgi:peroxiredoxin family protein
MSDDAPLNLVLFSGTADKLHSAATLAAGAAALDRPVNILLQYWALDAFRSSQIGTNRGLASDAMGEGARQPVKGAAAIGWLEAFRMAKELGTVTVYACTGSMDVLGIEAAELDPIVDEPAGIAMFLLAAGDGQIVVI